MEHWWNDIGRGKPKYLNKYLSQCHFNHHKSHTDLESNPGLRGKRLAINSLSQALTFNAKV
jgi:hypothetical protein